MLPENITVEQAKAELQQLIKAEPDNTGWAEVDSHYKDSGCVYFLDEDGQPVSPSNYDEGRDYQSSNLVTPVCLIGRWIYDFHRELMGDPQINMLLHENRSIGSCFDGELPFNDEVFNLLKRAQATQDMDGVTWGDIDLNVYF